MSLIHSSVLVIICMFTTLYSYQSAPEYFHEAAQKYILKGDTKNALLIIKEGLEKFPSDPQLTRLAGKIKEEQEQQNQQDQNKDQQNKDKQDQNKDQNKDQNQQQNKNDQQKNDKQDQQNSEQKQDQNKEKQNEQQKQQEQNKNDQQQKQQQQQKSVQQQNEKEMKKEEAKRIIELYADDADTLNKPPKMGIGKQQQPERDW